MLNLTVKTAMNQAPEDYCSFSEILKIFAYYTLQNALPPSKMVKIFIKFPIVNPSKSVVHISISIPEFSQLKRHSGRISPMLVVLDTEHISLQVCC